MEDIMKDVLERFEKSVNNVAPLGATFKFMLDDNAVFIDGNGDSNIVSAEDKEADCTVTCSLDTLNALRKGELNPMMAVMGGKVKIKGDMGLAMKLQSILA